MKIFKLDETYSIVCEWVNTRNGFKHVAKLIKGSYDVNETKICYLNRTWERYEYESVVHKLIDMNFKGDEAYHFKMICKEVEK